MSVPSHYRVINWDAAARSLEAVAAFCFPLNRLAPSLQPSVLFIDPQPELNWLLRSISLGNEITITEWLWCPPGFMGKFANLIKAETTSQWWAELRERVRPSSSELQPHWSLFGPTASLLVLQWSAKCPGQRSAVQTTSPPRLKHRYFTGLWQPASCALPHGLRVSRRSL